MAHTSSLFPSRRIILALGLLAALSIVIYVVVSAPSNGLGFPLDDAWIHQTYARNLALRGEWAFNPGETSAGATSPLWVVVLAPGYLLGAAPYVWTLLLGWLALWGIGLFGAAGIAALLPKFAKWSAWVGVMLVVEFHLVWAAASGMETALFAAVCLAVMVVSLAPRMKNRYWLAGLLSGGAVLLRPEGSTLLVPILLIIAISRDEQKEKIRALFQLAAGFLVIFLPYLLFNWSVSGSFWPNTFYAKQAEYASLLDQPILTRLAQQWSLPLIGPGLLLVSGFFLWLGRVVQEKNWAQLAWMAWALGLLALFAFRLPVTYQHGRYAMPAMPVLFVLGAAGMVAWLQPVGRQPAWRRRLSFAWAAALTLITLAFYGLGAKAYQRDAAFINTEMVAAANWIAANTPQDSLIGAHDIGALGYFSERRVVDLAGLVSPEVIPFMHNEPRLADELYAWGADYLVTFPGLYPLLSSQAELLYETTGVGPEQGGENMAVYRWYSLAE